MKKTALILAGLVMTVSSVAACQEARQILELSGVQGGLVVVIGCNSPELLAELRATGSYLVHGLDRDPAKVAAARKYLAVKGLSRRVTVSCWDETRLPLVDQTVKLLVLADPSSAVSGEEASRVVCPLGVVADLRGGTVKISRKAWPAELDQWTHWLYGASNNAVCADTAVDPPRGLRWTAGPKFARSHEHLASLGAMVTAAGRVFYVIDTGPISSVFLPPKWKLVARDAFSGVLLWERPIEGWASHLRGFRSGPPELPRRLVAGSDRVYVAGNLGEPVVVLDAATGERLFTVSGTRGARELLLAGGVLYVLADDMTVDEHEQRKKWIAGVWPKLEIWYRFPRQARPIYGRQRIVAIGAQSGELLWRQQFHQPGEILPATMAVAEGRLCVQTVSGVVCFDAADGKRLWQASHPVARSRFSWSTPTLVIHDGVVLVADRRAHDAADNSPPAEGSKWILSSGDSERRKQPGELVAWALASGHELWRATCFENYNTQIDVFVIGGVVWVSNLRHGGDPGFTQGRDLKTGRVVASCPPQPGWGHHRCYRNKATAKWVLTGRGGVQFVDLSKGVRENCPWVRGACQYGVMPANGLIYAPPHSCACVADGLLVGFNALAPRSSAAEGSPALLKGPAYGRVPAAGRSPARGNWPTYRGNARRSGFQNLPAPHRPGVVWTAKLSAPITAPVVADGLVLVAETDRHTVHALSAADGKSLWSFTAGGRIDSPPTLWHGYCLFGTRNGFVYCLRAADGALAWRYRAAPCDRRLVSYEQLESVWPVHGSILVDQQGSDAAATAYVAAGRSSDLDGGIYLYALDVATGRVLHRSRACTRAGPRERNVIRKRVMADILSLEHDTVWMRAVGMDRNLKPAGEKPHLFAPRGFLDDTWWHRTYWVYGTAIGSGYSNWPTAGNLVPAGRLLAFDDSGLIYGYGRMRYRRGNGHVRPPGAGAYKLFAERLPAAAGYWKDQLRAGAVAGKLPYRRKIEWASELPFVARAMVLASDALLVSAGPSLPGAGKSGEPGTLWIVSRSQGRRLAECCLPAVPVLDGMALSACGVVVSMVDGTVACLREGHKPAESSRAAQPAVQPAAGPVRKPNVKRPNVLFIAVDDLNDWVGSLGGHPQAKTPHIDRLAQQGVLFERAYCAAPLCNPSRTAIMTGLRPSSTGIYCNKAWFRDIPRYQDWETLPQYFRRHGYLALTGGKVFHQAAGKFSDPVSWDRQYSLKMGTPPPPRERRLRHGMSGKFKIDYYNSWLDWAPIDRPDEQTDDWRTADLAAQFLKQEHERPFFLACGFFRPHLSWYVPRRYFEVHPLEAIQLPAYKEKDLADVPSMGRAMAGEVFRIVREHGQWKHAVQGYLAACSFADACVGHVLEALQKSPYRDNTIVVLWGDHGYHLGEKDHFAKSALWEPACHTPLIIYAPGVSRQGAMCRHPVSLVDLYPTLIELCGLPPREGLDGHSLAPLVRDPQAEWPYPAVITHSPWWRGPNHAICSAKYYYIHYRDGGEELYDMSSDPHQWTNLAYDPKYSALKNRLIRWLPQSNARHFRGRPIGHE